jgi:hypothetical protein
MLNKLLKAWDHFWFSPRKLVNLALMRILLIGTMLHLYFLRSWNIDYFTDKWFMPRSLALETMDEFTRPLWGWFFWPDSMAGGIHALYVLMLLLLFFGVGGRVLAALTWVLHMGFLYRNYGAMFGADVIAGVFLFYLAFTDSCARLSILNFFKGKKPLRMESDVLTSAMMRMMQFQICIIYAYTGFEKLKGLSWWDGTALWSVLANPQMVNMDWSFLRHVPLVIAVGSFTSIIFEVYFPAAMLNPKGRKYWLVIGVLFHLSIGLIMGLMHFSLVMISTYFLFLAPEFLEGLVSGLKKKLFSSQFEIK